jgi:hypothetical protein
MIACAVVFFELWAIAYIRARYIYAVPAGGLPDRPCSASAF